MHHSAEPGKTSKVQVQGDGWIIPVCLQTTQHSCMKGDSKGFTPPVITTDILPSDTHAYFNPSSKAVNTLSQHDDVTGTPISWLLSPHCITRVSLSATCNPASKLVNHICPHDDVIGFPLVLALLLLPPKTSKGYHNFMLWLEVVAQA